MTGVADLSLALFLLAAPVLMLSMLIWVTMPGRKPTHRSHQFAVRSYRGFRRSYVAGCYLPIATAEVQADQVSQSHYGGHARVARANSDELFELAVLCLSDLRRESVARTGGKRDRRVRLGRVAWNPYLH